MSDIKNIPSFPPSRKEPDPQKQKFERNPPKKFDKTSKKDDDKKDKDSPFDVLHKKQHAGGQHSSDLDFSAKGSEEISEISKISAEDWQKLIDQTTEGLSIVSKEGITHTEIILKDIHGFENARIHIEATAQAPKQFNIRFTNLTQEAENRILAHQNSLKERFTKSGFTIQNIETTQLEIKHPHASGETRQGYKEQSGEQREGKKDQKKEE